MAAEPEIRAEVMAKYGEQLKVAGFLGRLWLRMKIDREVRDRVSQITTPDALY